jgi:hypothetical protein
MEIKKENIATYGLGTWEHTGTIAFDFANYLDKLPSIDGINLHELLENGWHHVGFRFGKSLINNSDTLKLDIILSRKVDDENYEFGYVSRSISKDVFLNMIVNFSAQISNRSHFEKDDISWRELNNIEE